MNDNIMDKISLRNTDYLASIGIDNELLLINLLKSSSGLVCAGSNMNKKMFVDLRSVRSLESEKDLDDGAFDKIVAVYSDYLSIDDLVRATDHFGMVLIVDIPKEIIADPRVIGGKKGILKKFYDRGIFEVWFLEGNQKDTFELLFKVRKYV
jgi:hypothetical protein